MIMQTAFQRSGTLTRSSSALMVPSSRDLVSVMAWLTVVASLKRTSPGMPARNLFRLALTTGRLVSLKSADYFMHMDGAQGTSVLELYVKGDIYPIKETACVPGVFVYKQTHTRAHTSLQRL